MGAGIVGPEDSAATTSEHQTSSVRPSVAVPPRPVTLPPRPANSRPSVPSISQPLQQLSSDPRAAMKNGTTGIPQAPRLPALPPPLPAAGQAKALRLGPPALPPLPAPARRSAVPPPTNGARTSFAGVQSDPSDAQRSIDDAARARQLQASLGQVKQSLAGKESELRALSAERDSLRIQLAEREEHIKQLQARSVLEIELRGRIAALERASMDLSSRLADSENSLSKSEKRVAELEQELERRERESARARPTQSERQRDTRTADARTPDAPEPGQSSSGDDLKQIRGIGPVFERALKAAGVDSFARIAALTPSEVATLAGQINVSVERIRRGAWIERAAELSRQRVPEQP
jgi:predicted flap endonuclease-1-like 5' DNA nuclease